MDDGWFQQPHLATSDWTLGLGVRLHTCCALSNQCAQVKSPHTLRERAPAWRWGALVMLIYGNFYNKPDFNITLCRSPVK